jgi:hypothetical protein
MWTQGGEKNLPVCAFYYLQHRGYRPIRALSTKAMAIQSAYLQISLSQKVSTPPPFFFSMAERQMFANIIKPIFHTYASSAGDRLGLT